MPILHTGPECTVSVLVGFLLWVDMEGLLEKLVVVFAVGTGKVGHLVQGLLCWNEAGDEELLLNKYLTCQVYHKSLRLGSLLVPNPGLYMHLVTGMAPSRDWRHRQAVENVW